MILVRGSGIPVGMSGLQDIGALVLLVVIWSPPWGGHPIALPMNLRIRRKGGPTPVDMGRR